MIGQIGTDVSSDAAHDLLVLNNQAGWGFFKLAAAKSLFPFSLNLDARMEGKKILGQWSRTEKGTS